MKTDKRETAVTLEKKDLSEIVVGKTFDMSVLESMPDDSSKKQKDAAKGLLIELKKRILDIQFENLGKADKLKAAKKKLKEHPFVKAVTELNADVKKNNKMIGELMSVYTGALKMTEKVGVKLDSKTLKELKEATR